MDLFTMVVVIVCVGCATEVISRYFKTRGKTNPELRERIERLEALVGDDSLEERVQALETIVTDRKKNLADQIHNL
ncbi:MAG: hypothetical protein F4W90_07015 [Gammaproteobacteria bacterium]|nr:hypothetical protein [Gammaproteobacteria bacterium]